jgi:hypothetical protein
MTSYLSLPALRGGGILFVAESGAHRPKQILSNAAAEQWGRGRPGPYSKESSR